MTPSVKAKQFRWPYCFLVLDSSTAKLMPYHPYAPPPPNQQLDLDTKENLSIGSKGQSCLTFAFLYHSHSTLQFEWRGCWPAGHCCAKLWGYVLQCMLDVLSYTNHFQCCNLSPPKCWSADHCCATLWGYVLQSMLDVLSYIIHSQRCSLSGEGGDQLVIVVLNLEVMFSSACRRPALSLVRW